MQILGRLIGFLVFEFLVIAVSTFIIYLWALAVFVKLEFGYMELRGLILPSILIPLYLAIDAALFSFMRGVSVVSFTYGLMAGSAIVSIVIIYVFRVLNEVPSQAGNIFDIALAVLVFAVPAALASVAVRNEGKVLFRTKK